MRLLRRENPKILKGMKHGVDTFILHLAPARLSGYNVCPMATEGCRAGCLNTAGRGGMFPGQVVAHLTGSELVENITSGKLHSRIQASRIAKTKMFFERRDAFMMQLAREIRAKENTARKRGRKIAIRLNGTSDIRWEHVTVGSKVNSTYAAPNLMTMFPNVQFYDYTKIANRNVPANYHLTFSLAENNDSAALDALKRNMNVAVVFRTKNFPDTFMGHSIINGDENDLRFLDPSPVIVGLKAKGKAKRDTSGFVKD